MDDIARETGLTKKTVSRVFANSNLVKASTRERVLEAAKRLHYEVNMLARNFNLKRSGYIGIAMHYQQILDGPYVAEAFKGFRRAISDESDYVFALFDTESESCNNGTKLAKFYRQRRVDGILVLAPHTDDQFLGTLKQLAVPLVVVGEKPTCSSVCSVFCNDGLGIELVCNHLYSLGHRRIAFVEGPSIYAVAIRRKKAFLHFLHEKGLNNPSWYIQPGDFSSRSGSAAGEILLQGNPPPTAIVTCNDTMAVAVMGIAQKLGLRIPEDVSVAGFDDLLPLNGGYFPPLTTAHQPVCEMAEWGARVLLNSLQTGVLPSGKTVMDVSLTIRESTGVPKHTNGASSPKQKKLKTRNDSDVTYEVQQPPVH